MTKIPLLITGALTVIAVIAGVYVAFCAPLMYSEAIQGEIGIFATYGALVSAAFVVYSYIQTNSAFIESQRPQLYLWIESLKGKHDNNSTETFPVTRIHYKNTTANQFSDLTIDVKVEANGQVFDLGDLFRPNMIMIGHDQRQKWFNTLEVLNEKGCDINALVASSTDVYLKLSYEFGYTGQKKIIPCQEYKWDQKLQQWVIP